MFYLMCLQVAVFNLKYLRSCPITCIVFYVCLFVCLFSKGVFRRFCAMLDAKFLFLFRGLGIRFY